MSDDAPRLPPRPSRTVYRDSSARSRWALRECLHLVDHFRFFVVAGRDSPARRYRVRVDGGHQHTQDHAAPPEHRDVGDLLRGLPRPHARSPSTCVARPPVPSVSRTLTGRRSERSRRRDGMPTARSGPRTAPSSSTSNGTPPPRNSGTCSSSTSRPVNGRRSRTSIRRSGGTGGSRSRASRRMARTSSSTFREGTTATRPGTSGPCRSPAERRTSSAPTSGGVASLLSARGPRGSRPSTRRASPAASFTS